MQYYLPGLDEADEGHGPKFKLEYVTFPASALHPPPPAEGAENAAGGRKFAYPIPRRHLPRTLKNGTAHRSKKYAPYALEDLTVGAWAGLARRLGRAKGKGLRQRFREFMYMGGAEA